MIRFRQKTFSPALLAGLLTPTNALLAGTSIAGMKQSSDQAEEAEKQAEETKAALDRQTKALNKIAREAKSNPEVAQKVIQQKQMSEEDGRIRLFAAISPGTVKNITGFAKDMWQTQKGNVGKATKIGLSFGAMGYAGNRLTTSLKDHDEGNDDKNIGFLKKAALTGAAIGGTYLAARKGKLGTKPIEALGGKTGSQAVQGGIEKVGKVINPIQRKDGKIDKLTTGLNTAFIGMPVLGYLGQRQQVQDQAKQTEKAYSDDSESSGTGKKFLKLGAGILGTAGTIALAKQGKLGGHAQRLTGNIIANTGGLMKSAGLKAGDKVARTGAQTYAQGVAQKGPISNLDLKLAEDKKFRQVTSPARISGGVSKVGSFLGFYGKGGTNAVQHTANSLAGSKNSEISRKVGTYMQNHKTAANIGAGVGSVAVGTSIMSAAGKPFKAFDKHAYDYEEQQNKQVE